MKQPGSWNWARIEARIRVKEELFSIKNKSLQDYKTFLSKYSSDPMVGVEGKIKIFMRRICFKCMQRHVDKRLALGEDIESILNK